MILPVDSLILACATCMGSASDHATKAAGVSILFLLVVVLLVGGAMVRFFLFLAKCERRTRPMAPAISPEQPGGPLSTSARE